MFGDDDVDGLMLWYKSAVSSHGLPASDVDMGWDVDSQFARICKLNGFARIRPGYARLLDIVRIAMILTASPAARIRNSY